MSFSVFRAVSNPFVRDTLRTQLRFHFPAITEVSYTSDAVFIAVARDADVSEADVSAVVHRVADSFAKLPAVPVRVRYDSHARVGADGAPVQHDVDALRYAVGKLAQDVEEALENGPQNGDPALAVGTWPVGRGLNLYGHEGAALQRCLDQFLRRYFQHAYGAQELRTPSMLPTTVVQRSGYIDTARQHLSFVSPINPSPERFDGFLPFWQAAAPEGTCDDEGVYRFLSVPQDVLNPALCLHCYPLLAGARVSSGTPVAFTLAGSCFRDESGNLNHAERLREFSMREAVFIGGPAALDCIYGELVDFTIATAAMLGLDFRLETAADIFFNDGAPQRLFSQLMSDNKLELSVVDAEGITRFSAASINKHQTHFTVPFQTNLEDGASAVSMCIGFGLDRLALAVADKARSAGLPPLRRLGNSARASLAQHGLAESAR